jgi:hypothetical protein
MGARDTRCSACYRLGFLMVSDKMYPMNSYRKRDLVLRDLGFSGYAEYLSSPLWESIRSRVLDRDEHSCVRCGSRAWQVHHSSYSSMVLLGEDLVGLHSVCRECHELAEFLPSGSKATMEEANERLGISRPPIRRPSRIRTKMRRGLGTAIAMMRSYSNQLRGD